MPKLEEFIANQAQKESYEWMNKSPHPLPIFKHDGIVMGRRNGSWVKAAIITSSAVGCSVQFVQDKKTMNLYDARCIRSAQDFNCM